MKAFIVLSLFILSLCFFESSSSWINNEKPILNYNFIRDARDSNGQNHGEVHGATLTSDIADRQDCAYYFNGQNSYITTPSKTFNLLDLSNGFTIALWFKPDRGGLPNAIDIHVGKEILFEISDSITVYLNDASVSAEIIINSDEHLQRKTFSIKGPTNVRSTLWNHIVLTYDMRTLELYHNFEVDQTKHIGELFPGTIHSSHRFVRVGAGKGSGIFQNFYQGKIDDVRVYATVLNEEELRNTFGKITLVGYPSRSDGIDWLMGFFLLILMMVVTVVLLLVLFGNRIIPCIKAIFIKDNNPEHVSDI